MARQCDVDTRPARVSLNNRYGTHNVDAMNQASANNSVVYIPVNNQFQESILYREIRQRTDTPSAAWDKYLEALHNQTGTTAVDQNGEPQFQSSMVGGAPVHPPTGPEIIGEGIDQADNITRRLKELLKSLDKKMTKSLQGPTASTAHLYRLMRTLKDDASRLALVKFITYTSAYTHMMDSVLENQYSDLSTIDDFAQTHKNFKLYLELTSHIQDVEQLIATDPKTKQFIENTNLTKTIKSITSKRSSIENRMKALSKAAVRKTIAEASTVEHSRFREEMRRTFETNNDRGKLSKAEYKEKRDKWVEQQVTLNKDMLQRREDAYAARIVEAKHFSINHLDMWLTDAESLNDPLIQHAAELLRRAEFNRQQRSREKSRQAIELFQKWSSAVSGRKTQEEKYAEVIEDRIKTDADGFIVYDDKGNFVMEKGKKSRYMVDEYFQQFYTEKAKRESKLEQLQAEGKTAEANAYERELSDWYAENTVFDALTQEREPNQKWLNPQARHLAKLQQQKSVLYDMYEFLINTQQEADFALPSKYLRINNKIPQVEQSVYEKGEAQGFFKQMQWWLRGKTTVRPDDVEYGGLNPEEGMAKLNSELQKKTSDMVPIHYRANVELDNLSYDLLTSVLLNYDNSILFAERTEIEAELEMMKSVAADRTVFTGKKTVIMPYQKGDENDPFKQVFEDENGTMMSRRFIEGQAGVESKEFRALDSFLQDRLYGRSTESSPLHDKLAKEAMGYTGMLMLGLNYKSGVRNLMQGNIQNWIEANAGGRLSNANMRKAHALYFKEDGLGMAALMGDVGRVTPTSMTGLLVDKFNAFTEWSVVDRKFSDQSWWRRNVKLAHLNVFNNLAERNIQGVLMYAIMDTIEVDGPKGKIKLHEAYEKKDGRLVPKKGVKVTPEIEFQASRLIQDYKKRLQGNYDNNMRAMAQRHAMGQLFVMFRKWMGSGYKRRFRGAGDWKSVLSGDITTRRNEFYNFNTQEFEDGAYTATARFMAGFVRDFKKYRFDFHAYQLANWNNMTIEDKADIKRTVMEMGLMVGTFAVAMLARAEWKDATDDDEKRAWATLAYFSMALKSELAFYVNPFDALKTVKNPSAVVKTMEMVLRTLIAAWPGNWADEYENGKLKGQNKLWYALKQMMPGYRGLNSDVEFQNQFLFGNR